MKLRDLIYLFLAVLLIPSIASSASLSTPQTQWHQPRFGDITSAVDGYLYILDQANEEVIKLIPDGQPIWRQRLVGLDGKPIQAYGLFAVPPQKGNIRIVGNASGIYDISTDGKLTQVYASVGRYTDRLCGMDQEGRVYFPDKENNRVLRLSEKADAKDSGVECDHGIKLADGSAPVVDLVIDGSVPGPGHFGRPNRVDIDGLGNIWVLDQSYVYRIFDKDGQFVAQVHAPDAKNRSFTNVGFKCDAAGSVYICSKETRRILKYDGKGRFYGSETLGSYPMVFGSDDERLYIGNPANSSGDVSIKVFDWRSKQTETILIPHGTVSGISDEYKLGCADDIREAVFRYQIDHMMRDGFAKVCFISLGDAFSPRILPSEDPGDEFIARFADLSFPVKKASQGVADRQRGSFVDKESKERGIVFSASNISWIDEKEVSVQGGYYVANLSASADIYIVVLKNGRWTVKRDIVRAVS